MEKPDLAGEVHEFGFDVYFTKVSLTGVLINSAVRVLRTLTRRPSEVSYVSGLVVDDGCWALRTHRRGTDPLRAVLDTAREMREAGLHVTDVAGVVRHETESTLALLGDVADTANARLAEDSDAAARVTRQATSEDTPTRQRVRKERLDYLLTVLDRIGCDNPRTRDAHPHFRCVETPVGALAASAARKVRAARRRGLVRGELRPLRRGLVALTLCRVNRIWPDAWEVTADQLNDVDYRYASAFVSQWRRHTTAEGSHEAVFELALRGSRSGKGFLINHPELIALSVADILDATVNLDRPPGEDQ